MSRTEAETLEAHIVNHLDRILDKNLFSAADAAHVNQNKI